MFLHPRLESSGAAPPLTLSSSFWPLLLFPLFGHHPYRVPAVPFLPSRRLIVGERDYTKKRRTAQNGNKTALIIFFKPQVRDGVATRGAWSPLHARLGRV